MDLSSYIRKLLSQGYSLDSIRSVLLKYGYQPRDIDAAIYNLDKSPKKIPLNKILLVLGIVAILALVSILAYFFWPSSTPKQVNIAISLISVSDIEAGSDTTIEYELNNPSDQENLNVYVKFEAFDNNNNRIAWTSKNINLDAETTDTATLNIPSNTAAGTYTLKASARYKASQPYDQDSFQVTSSQPECPDSCDDGNPDTDDYCNAQTNYECVNEQKDDTPDNPPDDGPGDDTPEDTHSQPYVNPWDELDRINDLAKSNPGKAQADCQNLAENYIDHCLDNVGQESKNAAICGKITDDYYREKCYSNVAKELNDKALCEKIAHEDRKNSCYINFAVKGDYTVCEKITNPYVRRSCETLKQAQG